MRYNILSQIDRKTLLRMRATDIERLLTKLESQNGK